MEPRATPPNRLLPRLRLQDVAALASRDVGPAFFRSQWEFWSRLPGGTVVFSRVVGRAAPYTAPIHGRIVELRPGYSRVEMEDRPSIRNHLSSIHAVALANLAEMTGNVALLYGMPDDARFIVTRLEIDYVKKARGRIVGTCNAPIPATSDRYEYPVPVELRDTSGDLVAKASLRSLVGPRKKAPRINP